MSTYPSVLLLRKLCVARRECWQHCVFAVSQTVKTVIGRLPFITTRVRRNIENLVHRDCMRCSLLCSDISCNTERLGNVKVCTARGDSEYLPVDRIALEALSGGIPVAVPVSAVKIRACVCCSSCPRSVLESFCLTRCFYMETSKASRHT